MIHLQDVEVVVGARVQLARTTLEVKESARLALVGASGAGKSTLLRLVLGLTTPTAGSVIAFGQPMTLATRESLRLRMGYVVQEGGLFPHLTARANAAIMAKHLGWSARRIEARTTELGALVGVSPELFDRFPFQLSGGQRQRVGLARALMLDPEILLLDEPFAALDPVSSARLEDDLLAIIRRLHKTLLFVTHDVAQAGRIGDEVAVVHEGRIVQRASFETLSKHPAHPFVTELLDARRSAPCPPGAPT